MSTMPLWQRATSYNVDEDTTLTVTAPGVLENDTDIDHYGDTLTAILVNDVSNGTLSLYFDGSFSYTPNADFNGSDSFTYLAVDSTAGSLITTATITVNPVNDPPIVSNIFDQTIVEGTTFTTITLDDHVTDVDNTDFDQITWTYKW